jgi:hypothetical protein
VTKCKRSEALMMLEGRIQLSYSNYSQTYPVLLLQQLTITEQRYIERTSIEFLVVLYHLSSGIEVAFSDVLQASSDSSLDCVLPLNNIK